ncbi:hypothetical protein H6G81_19655 [Scytonema hofmannii FACHB-248]|uniref:Uncharacterized protein n=1 Tax=Scytonema hofmannii FACHB-248 TaxID=1842502 RepID=A0ABR8GVA3_9CYAN|nr:MULTISPECIES: hypothetical protein [Nostocales]MBD2606688.1 hypothetical protein [Scytonema hofmannii FACHB-248]
MKFLNVFATVGVVSIIGIAGVVASPNSASAYHKTNKWERRGNLENGWTVFYSKEISHEEELKIAGVIALDATVSGGGATATYFSNFARESLAQLSREASKKSPAVAQTLQRELTVQKLLSSIRASFSGNEVNMRIAGLSIAVGKETYNRAECLKVFGKPRCTSMPNTYQPYIRIRN